jgi:uncharacterized protein (TIGR00251 family)
MARRISVTVKPNARSAAIAQVSEVELRVAIREPARDGKANLALVDLLARYFDVPKSSVTIVRGHASRKKIIEMR